MKTGIELIAIERKRQIEVEGYTPYEDQQKYENDELFNAASSYSARDEFRNKDEKGVPSAWPWGAEFWKPTPENRIRELVKAGALFTAHQELTGFDCSKQIESCVRRINREIKHNPLKQ